MVYDDCTINSFYNLKQIRNSDIYIGNWSGLINLLDEIDIITLQEKIQTTKDQVIAAEIEQESSNFRDDLIFVTIIGGTALIVARTGAAILSGGSVLKYPGNDPNTPPCKGWEFRGSGTPS